MWPIILISQVDLWIIIFLMDSDYEVAEIAYRFVCFMFLRIPGILKAIVF